MRSTEMFEWAALPLRRGLSCLLALFVVVAGCDGGGTSGDGTDAPVVEAAIQDQDATAGGEAIEIDLGPVFSAPSGAALSYGASSSDSTVARVSVSGGRLRVVPQTGGTADVTVTASNEAGEATDRFGVSVFAGPPERPPE